VFADCFRRKMEMKCPVCGKKVPDYYDCYTDEACHEIHINQEKEAHLK